MMRASYFEFIEYLRQTRGDILDPRRLEYSRGENTGRVGTRARQCLAGSVRRRANPGGSSYPRMRWHHLDESRGGRRQQDERANHKRSSRDPWTAARVDAPLRSPDACSAACFEKWRNSKRDDTRLL